MSLLLVLVAFLLTGCGSPPPDPATPVEAQPTAAQAASGEYISWWERRIDDKGKSGGMELRGAQALVQGDFDADGRPDVVTAFADSGQLRIAYGSDDSDTWFRLTLAEGDEVGGLRWVAAGDLNADGHDDLIVAGESAGLMYLKNPASEHRGFRWERIHPQPALIASGWTRALFADLDGDGRPEIVAAGESGLSIFRIEGDPLVHESWREQSLGLASTPGGLYTADLDGDGDLDIVVGSRADRKLYWFENLGGLELRQHDIELTDGKAAGGEIVFHDFSGDGRLDMATALDGSRLAWLEQPGSADEPWKTHLIGDIAPDEPAGLLLADIDQDGAPDLIVGSASAGPADEDAADAADPVGRIAWFRKADASEWTRHDILRRVRSNYSAWTALDQDGDGDLDLIGARGGSGSLDGLIWLEQRRSAQPVRRLIGALEQESRALPLP